MPQCYKIGDDGAMKLLPPSECGESYSVLDAIDGIYLHVDQAVLGFTSNLYQQLVIDLAGTIALLSTLYVVIYGWLILRGSVKLSLVDGAFRLFWFVVILTFATSWGWFSEMVYTLFTDTPNELAAVITRAVGGIHFYGTETPRSAISVLVARGWKLAALIWNQGGAGYVLSVFTFLLTGFVGVLASGLVLLAKIALGLLLGLAPLFFLFAAFQSTRGFFESWLRQCFTFALFTPLVAGLTAISMQLLIGPFEFALQNAEKNQIDLATLVPFVFVGSVVVYLFSQVQGIAAQLGGGFAMQTYKGWEYTRGSYNRLRQRLNKPTRVPSPA